MLLLVPSPYLPPFVPSPLNPIPQNRKRPKGKEAAEEAARLQRLREEEMARGPQDLRWTWEPETGLGMLVALGPKDGAGIVDGKMLAHKLVVHLKSRDLMTTRLRAMLRLPEPGPEEAGTPASPKPETPKTSATTTPIAAGRAMLAAAAKK